MTHDELIAEACRLAEESAENGWGGPFGAVIAKDGEIIARGQNRVLLTGDITAHAEMEAIRKAVRVLNPYSPSISPENQNKSTLAFVPRPDGSRDPLPERARMLMGYEIFISSVPCPMCMSAIYWARLDAVYFACNLEDTRKIGFEDAVQYEDFALPLDQRRIKIKQHRRDLGLKAFNAWSKKKVRHFY